MRVQRSNSQSSVWRTLATALLAILSLAAISCKTSKDAHALAAQITETASNLSEYYAALATIAENDARLERLQQAIMGVPLEPQDMAQLKDVQNELKKRADAAHALAEIAQAFAKLSGSSAPTEASKAASDLGTELSSIQQLPGASYAPTSLQNAGKLLTQFAQERDERKMARNIEPTLSALSEMFSKEKPAYESINRTYIALAQSLALDLVSKNQVDPGSLLAPALHPFGLASRMPAAEIPQGLQDYAREQIKTQGEAEIAAHTTAINAMESALKEVAAHAHQLASEGHIPEQSLTLSSVEAWTKRAQ